MLKNRYIALTFCKKEKYIEEEVDWKSPYSTFVFSMGQVIFYIILFYLLYNLVFKFVIPIVLASRKVRAAMKDMRQGHGQFENRDENTYTEQKTYTKATGKNTSASKGDYIEFEEVK